RRSERFATSAPSVSFSGNTTESPLPPNPPRMHVLCADFHRHFWDPRLTRVFRRTDSTSLCYSTMAVSQHTPSDECDDTAITRRRRPFYKQQSNVSIAFGTGCPLL